ncbi:hypothetical protein IQ238_02840 [Pleurocapsales cyanobacterium LEGE 06147]|nr:hypothetical protein [Pleurocapsales cyanobacterium LEGE 06147]
MPSTEEIKIRYQIASPGLPLAVYREVAAHLRQISGISAGLIPQPMSNDEDSEIKERQQFDYGKSQVGGLWLEYCKDIDEASKQRLDEILDYYGQRYRPWERY